MLKLLACVALATMLLFIAACDDDDGDGDSDAAALTITERMLTTGDLPGYDLVEEFTWDTAEGVRDEALGAAAIEASAEDALSAARDAGFKVGAGRVFERDDATAPADFVAVFALELESSEGARDVLAFNADDSEQPCPETCAFEVTEKDVEGIPGARGVLRLATEESLAELNETEMGPGEIHRIAFTDGPFFYFINMVNMPPSDNTADTVQSIAEELYERVKGASRSKSN